MLAKPTAQPTPPTPPPGAAKASGRALALILALVCGLLTVWAGWALVQRHTQAELGRVAPLQAQLVQHELMANLEFLRHVALFFIASQKVERGEFRSFTQFSLPHTRGVAFVAYAPRVEGDQRASHEEQTRRQGYPQYRLLEPVPAATWRPPAPGANTIPCISCRP